MSDSFSEKTFLINLLTEITRSETLKEKEPLLVKLTNQYRNYLLRTELSEKLAQYRRRESELKVSLLQSIKSDQWTESARITTEISELTAQKTEVLAKIEELTNDV